MGLEAERYGSRGWYFRLWQPLLGGLLLVLASLPAHALQPPPQPAPTTASTKRAHKPLRQTTTRPATLPQLAAPAASSALPALPPLGPGATGGADLSSGGPGLPASVAAADAGGAPLAPAAGASPPPAAAPAVLAAPATQPALLAPRSLRPEVQRPSLPHPILQGLPRGTLVRLVSRLRACLPAISPPAQVTLRLRTGLGLPHSYNALQMAQVARISLQQENQLEQTAVAELQSAPRTSHCAGPGPRAATASPPRPGAPPSSHPAAHVLRAHAIRAAGRAHRAHARRRPARAISAAWLLLLAPIGWTAVALAARRRRIRAPAARRW